MKGQQNLRNIGNGSDCSKEGRAWVVSNSNNGTLMTQKKQIATDGFEPERKKKRLMRTALEIRIIGTLMTQKDT
jgi:hypothetical protein